MEYLLQIEQKKKFWIIPIAVSGLLLFIFFSNAFAGIYGLGGSIGIILCLLFTPFFIGRYKLFLLLWVFLIPFFDNIKPLLIGSTSIITYGITGITIPVAFFMIYKEFHKIQKEFPIIIFPIAFFLLMLINFFRSPLTLNMIGDILGFYVQIFVIVCTCIYLRKYSPERIFKFFAIFVIICCVLAIFQRITGIGTVFLDGAKRVQGLLGHPNAFAFLINLYFPVGIYKYICSDAIKEKRFWLISLIISFLGLVLSLSKTSFLLFAIMLFIMFLFLPLKHKSKIIFASVMGSILLIAVAFLFNINILNEIIMRFSNTSSWEWRLRIWGYMVHGFDLTSIFIGNGIGTAKFYLMGIDAGLQTIPHNIYLQMLFEYGILGSLYYIPFYVLAYIFLKSSLNKKIPNRISYIYPFIICVQIAIDLSASNSALLRTTMYWAWVVLVAFYIMLRKESLIPDETLITKNQ